MKYMFKEAVLGVCRMGITIFTIVISGGESSDTFMAPLARRCKTKFPTI